MSAHDHRAAPHPVPDYEAELKHLQDDVAALGSAMATPPPQSLQAEVMAEIARTPQLPSASSGTGTRGGTGIRVWHHPRSSTDKRGDPPPVTATQPAGAPIHRRRQLALRLILAALLLAGTGVTGTALVPRLLSGSPATDASWATGPQPDPTSAAPTVTAGAPSPTVVAPSPRPSKPPRDNTISPKPRKPAKNNTISGPVNARRAATFELVSNAASVNLRTAALGDDLYRITTPKDSATPNVKSTRAGIRLFLAKPDKRIDTTVDIVLNSRIRWSLTVTGDVASSVLNLSGATVGSVALNGGATRIDLTLPRPKGTISVQISGGANQFQIRTTDTAAVRVRIREGAGKVVFNGQTDKGVARGATFESPDFAGSGDRIDVDAIAGVGTLTVACA